MEETLPPGLVPLLSMISALPQNKRDFILGFLAARNPEDTEDALVDLSQNEYFEDE